ncbi:MAG: carboxypeptidase regulatory-like domain-containing protein [Thermoanaerobaculia bacterium]|nr:carboxypeptidase regulatory-like domain-containing protein [Thermoanaerobaculia bacterium]
MRRRKEGWRCSEKMLRTSSLLAAVLLTQTTPVMASGEGGTLVVTCHEDDTSTRLQPAGQPLPLPGTTVRVSTDPAMGPGLYGLRTGVADHHGQAVFFDLPPGDYWFETSLEGFVSRRWAVKVHARRTRRAVVPLSPYIPECSLYERWDLRLELDPGSPAPATFLTFEFTSDEP